MIQIIGQASIDIEPILWYGLMMNVFNVWCSMAFLGMVTHVTTNGHGQKQLNFINCFSSNRHMNYGVASYV